MNKYEVLNLRHPDQNPKQGQRDTTPASRHVRFVPSQPAKISDMGSEDYEKGYSEGQRSSDRKIERLKQELTRQIEELEDDFKHRLDNLTKKIERSERERSDGRGDDEAGKRHVRAVVDQFNNFWSNFWSGWAQMGPHDTPSNRRMQYPSGY